MSLRVADAIVRSLEAHGLSRVYCVPGESYLALLDALHDSNRIETIVCRHESGAGFMAVAEAKITGEPQCFMVSRGPGATNGSIAVHVAEQDAVPLVVLIGQVSREERGRNAFQEVDYSHFFGRMAKAVWEITDGSKTGEILARAFHLARSGVPGPVVVSLPEDVLGDGFEGVMPEPYPPVGIDASAEALGRVADLLAKAERPLIIAGGLMRGRRGASALARLAEVHQVPVAVSWKNQDVFDNASPLYAGHVGFGIPQKYRDTLAKADLVIALGTRLGDVASQNFTFPAAPDPRQPLVHIYPDPAPIGRVFRTDVGVVADPVVAAERLASRPASPPSRRSSWVQEIARFMEAFTRFESPRPADGVDFGTVVASLAAQAPRDAVIVTDAGNISTWVHRHWKMTPDNLLLGVIGGAMGFGVPGGTASSLVLKDRMAIVFVGDGGILMTGQELATALQYGARPKIVISDNGSYGTIRTHQEKHFPRRQSGTDLKNPDFTAWAKSFDAHVVRITTHDEVDARVQEALAHAGPSVIHVKSSLEAISAFTTLSALQAR
ncbi:MAG TPA: thiamine pyrophosphate-dependent enzyme [Aestuariivirgaceae bacterium]|nr:thiamine pyrophosphate-dependent enzyme [Aestuariivirgaceae bacterium]